MEDNKYVKKIALIYLRDKKILVLHKKTIDMYISPGGKVEKEECDSDCISREIMEELGCGVKDLSYFKTFRGKAPEGFNLQLKCYFGGLEGDITLNTNDNIDGYLWIGKDYDKKINLASLLRYKIIPSLVKKGLM